MGIDETTDRVTREILSPEELAAFLGCSRTFAYKLLAEGAIPSFKVGKLRRVRLSDARGYVERRLAEAERGSRETASYLGDGHGRRLSDSG